MPAKMKDYQETINKFVMEYCNKQDYAHNALFIYFMHTVCKSISITTITTIGAMVFFPA